LKVKDGVKRLPILSDPFSGDFPFKLSEGKQNIADNIALT